MSKIRRVSIIHNTNLSKFRDNTDYKSCRFYLVQCIDRDISNRFHIMLCTHNEGQGGILQIAFTFFDPADNSITHSFDEEYVRRNYKVLAKITEYVTISADLSQLSIPSCL